MAISTDQITFFDLCQHLFECDTISHHRADLAVLLPAHVVIVHDVVRIILMAVVAGGALFQAADHAADLRLVLVLVRLAVALNPLRVTKVEAPGRRPRVGWVLVRHPRPQDP